MRIVVNHVTRMTAPRICVAGIDPASVGHVRPITPPDDLIARALLRDEGGPFGMGAEVDLGPVHPEGSPPETEDHRFVTARAQHVRDMEADEFLELLSRVSAPNLQGAFGPALERIRWKYAVEPGHGERSLAVVRAATRPTLEVDTTFDKPKLQLRYSDPEPPTYLPVTDVRFYETDHKTIRVDAVEDVARRLRRGVGAFLMLGLARPWNAPGDDRERHWLQLNGLVLDDQPTSDEP
jgi:hypothetical protein